MVLSLCGGVLRASACRALWEPHWCKCVPLRSVGQRHQIEACALPTVHRCFSPQGMCWSALPCAGLAMPLVLFTVALPAGAVYPAPAPLVSRWQGALGLFRSRGPVWGEVVGVCAARLRRSPLSIGCPDCLRGSGRSMAKCHNSIKSPLFCPVWAENRGFTRV